MKNIRKYLILSTLILSLFACKQTPRKSEEINQVNKLLTTITIDALKNNEFLQAQRSITALILNDTNDTWKFIQSAIISLPKKLADEIIETSLKLPSVNNSPEQLFGFAKIYISYKNTDSALSTLNKALLLDKNYVEAKYWRAKLYTVMKKYEEAEIDFQYITKKHPLNEEYSGQYASFLQETKQYDKAQSMLAKHSATPDLLFKRIIFALQSENIELARDIFPDLKKLDVEEEISNHKNFLVAESAYWLKNIPESETYYRKVTGGDHYLDARDMLSLILYDDKRYSDSIEILHQLQNAEEQYAIKAYRLESKIYQTQGKIDEAILTLSRSLKLIPNNPILLYDRAMLNESQNNMEAVEKDLLQIIEDDPKNFQAYNALGYSLADHDLKLDEAYQYIKKAIEMSPNDPAIIDSLGWVQYKLGHYTEAEENFNKAIKYNIEDSELYIHLYKTLLKLKKLDTAKQILEKAKQMLPDNEKIINRLQ